MHISTELDPLVAPRRTGAPACLHCGSDVVRDFLTHPPLRQVNRVGSPARPRLPLPTWRCTSCGCVQPRIE